ncbi:uncharacterized protein LOC119743604 [Patiria miniata]|uniref:IgGFc-binding protein N-terminal domain-containing protein n=1 Tax=Patiria miniata TaxID=46514 RepID=A0A914BJE6_PATMI|nr:uncharacterized protein LOC119743604 [Patiria miniata]
MWHQEHAVGASTKRTLQLLCLSGVTGRSGLRPACRTRRAAMAYLYCLTTSLDLRVIFTVFILTFNLMGVVRSSASGRGREFIFAFPTHLYQPSLATSSTDRARLTLSITPFEERPTDVNVTVVSSNWSRVLKLPAQLGGMTVELPFESQAVGSGLQNNTVLVTASEDVTVLALSDNGKSTGGFLVRSAGTLGTDYFVVSYTPIVGEWSLFTVSAAEDDTVVHIQLKAPLVFDNAPYGREDLQISLNRFQTAQFQSSLDLTGTRVRANRPISVVSGSSGSNIPAEFGSAGYVVEHLPPVGAWGTVYALAPFPGRRSGYRCVVIAGCAMTMIRGFGDRAVLASAGDSFEWDAGDHVAVITSSTPVLVAQFSKGTEADEHVGVESGVGGPAMLIIQPIDLLVSGSGALLSTPALPPDAYHHISVTAPCKDTDGITLNGSPLVPDQKYEYDELDGFCTVQKTLQSDESSPIISVQHPAPSGVPLAVSVVVHGAGFKGAYAVSANLGAEVSPCEATSSDGCCFLEENSQLVSSLSYDEEGSMHSSDYELYNSIPGVVVALKAVVEGTTVQPSQDLTTMANTPKPTVTNGFLVTPFQTTNENPTETENVTEELDNLHSTAAESNSVSDTEVSSRPAETSTDSLNQQTGTSSVTTTRQAISTNSTPGGSTKTLVYSSASATTNQIISTTERKTVASTDQPEVTNGSASTGLPIITSTWIDSTQSPTEADMSTTLSTSVADRPTLSTSVVDRPTLSTSPAGAPTSTSLRPSSNITLSTWLAATLSTTVTRTVKEQTTEPVVDTTCSTCQRPFRILLYGGVAMATLLLLCMLICLVKIIRARRSAKTAHMKRNSRWVAFPASLSLDELHLGRMNLKASAGGDGPTTPPPTTTPTGTDEVKLGTGENVGVSSGTFKDESE